MSIKSVNMPARNRLSKVSSTDRIGDYIAESASTIFTLENQIATIDKIAALAVGTLSAGHTILTCGNGGSAGEGIQLREDLTGKYNKPRRALPAICLCSDASAMTCIANDWDF